MEQERKIINILKDKLPKIQNAIDYVNAVATDIWGKLREEEIGIILRWVSQILYEDYHYVARKGRTADIGGWLFEREGYRKW